ncbi:hypothetical protein V6N12_027823 [Hibiscus sabdariffa]|uniref:Uncharacterized protein n=1 Tax=Hibiscus sabdariffa TaxID=183260 RepID=A0ABR2F412_9ROSI
MPSLITTRIFQKNNHHHALNKESRSWEDSVDMANGNHKATKRDQVREKGKKKKDQALKKYKKVVKKAEFEDSGFHVPTGSDIARNHILTKSIKAKLERMNFEREKNVESIYIDAREALALDKSFGMEIVDNEEDVVEEMAGREAESSSSSSSGSSNQRRKSNSQSNQGGDISLIEHGMKSALENKEETLEKKSNSSKSSEEENCFNENNDFTNTLVEVSKSASPISIRPSWVNVVKKSLRVDNIEQTGDMGGAGLDPIAERVTTELEGNSIMDSDMQVRRNALLEEAKKKLSQLGKWWELRLLETRLKL